jgi:hypothetical protein
MDINRSSPTVKNSVQNNIGSSFDEDFGVLAVEMLEYDPTTSTLKRASGVASAFATNNIDEASATVTYIGKEDADGAWFIMKIDTSSGTAFTYATITNNTDQTTGYADAFADRATLTYSTYSTAF